MKHFEPQDGNRSLAPHAHRFELTGDPYSLAFPPVCPNCGGSASGSLLIRKIFRRTHSNSNHRTTYEIANARVPFCATCIARHESERERPSPLARIVARFATEATIPALFSGATGVFFLKEAARKAGEFGPSGATIPGIVALVLLMIAGACLLSAWRSNEKSQIPPQTSVTLAFDFGDEVAAIFDAPHRTYAIRDATFAEAFIAANAERQWDPASPRAREASRHRTVMYVAFGILLVATALWSILAPG